MTTDDKGLLNCPFCGGEASPDGVIRYSDSYVREQEWGQNEFYYCNCVRCGVSNRGLIGYRSQADAIAAWNRRPSPVLSAEDAALIADARYMVNNPSAWGQFDGSASNLLAELASRLEALSAENEAMKERVAVLEGEREWQPIETAPKDGTWFLALCAITIIGGGKPCRAAPRLDIVRRTRMSPESDGYWQSIWDHSIADDYLARARWAPLTAVPLQEMFERIEADRIALGGIPMSLPSPLTPAGRRALAEGGRE